VEIVTHCNLKTVRRRSRQLF